MFFVSNGKVMAAAFDPGTGTPGEPRRLFDVGYVQGLEAGLERGRFLVGEVSEGAFAPLTVG